MTAHHHRPPPADATLVRFNFDAHPVSFADALKEGAWRGLVTYVHDGDTLWTQLDRGFGDESSKSIRIADLYEAELSDADGAAKRDALATLAFGQYVLVRVRRTKSDREVFSFQRVVGDVTVVAKLPDGSVRRTDLLLAMERLGLAPRTRRRGHA